MLIVVFLIGIAVSCIILYAHHSAYNSDGKEINRLTFGKVIFWLIMWQIFAFGCLGSILDVSYGDLSKIGGQ